MQLRAIERVPAIPHITFHSWVTFNQIASTTLFNQRVGHRTIWLVKPKGPSNVFTEAQVPHFPDSKPISGKRSRHIASQDDRSKTRATRMERAPNKPKDLPDNPGPKQRKLAKPPLKLLRNDAQD